MEGNRLKRLLGELHRELGAAEQLDPESRRLIEEILADVDRIERSDEGPEIRDFRDLVLRLESEHPRLATALGQVADALGRIGI